jgi:hypothetical protein
MFDFTLVCADGGPNKELSKNIFNKMISTYKFKDCKFFDHTKTLQDYNTFILKELNNHISDGHVLIIQYDGYILNPSAWTPAFLEYDYIGAPWLTQPVSEDCKVGNGGFSLRSKKLLEETSLLHYDGTPEDIFICRTKSQYLREKGIKFAPISVAHNFSIENLPYKNQFGFHGEITIMINKQMGIFK